MGTSKNERHHFDVRWTAAGHAFLLQPCICRHFKHGPTTEHAPPTRSSSESAFVRPATHVYHMIRLGCLVILGYLFRLPLRRNSSNNPAAANAAAPASEQTVRLTSATSRCARRAVVLLPYFVPASNCVLCAHRPRKIDLSIANVWDQAGVST